jgi:hypothetical protein
MESVLLSCIILQKQYKPGFGEVIGQKFNILLVIHVDRGESVYPFSTFLFSIYHNTFWQANCPKGCNHDTLTKFRKIY